MARTPLPVEEEIRRAAEKDEKLRLKTRTAPAPPAAEEVFKKLIDHLPARMQPKQYEFTLTVLEHCDAEACALGAGRVYVSRDLLKIALADPRSGKEQLAFALAHQLGHLSLGHARRIYPAAVGE